MKLSNQRQGELYIISASMLGSLLPVIITLSFAGVSPFVSLAGSSFFSALFFAIILSIRQRWHEVIDVNALRYILLTAGILGVLFYTLYYLGLQISGPGNVSILALTEIGFSFLFFHVWHKEYIPKEHIVGAILIVIGALIILSPTIGQFRLGNILVILAASIAPFGNFFALKARKLVSTETIMFTRCLVSALALSAGVIMFQAPAAFNTIIPVLPFLIINGFLLSGLGTFLWVEGIYKISVTKANALQSIGPLLTLLFAWIVLKTTPSFFQILSFIPMFFGVMFISKKIKHA